ncbi:uncharacterized protein LOC131998380 [Stomoxys calcitrans]|uniref:uncharacterized protein LOC131998380 n=1 Tax=Stomoxys calcitrans TaxID=35570 RepID=UPI0027E2DFDB|nr:uncharacterized protein LOC131998380 [Stomoxys calcitrans]
MSVNTKQPNFEIDNKKLFKNYTIGPKYLMMSRTDSEETLINVSPFLIKKVIDSVCGEIEMCKKLRSGDILIKTKTATQATKLFQLISLTNEIKVEVKEHNSLNYSKGVIYCNDLRGIPENEILNELKKQNVTEVQKILKKNEDSLIETGLIIITFSLPNLPDEINIGYEKTCVRPYIPLPMRCRQCFHYGHPTKRCKNNKICISCGDIAHTQENELCQNNTKCINCDENKLDDKSHSVLSKKCPVFLKFKEIQAIKTLDKVDHKTALATYKQRHPNDTVYSKVTRSTVSYHDLPTTSNNNTNYAMCENKKQQQAKPSDPAPPQPLVSARDKPTTVNILPKNISKRTRNELKSKSAAINNPKKLCKNSTESDNLSDE